MSENILLNMDFSQATGLLPSGQKWRRSPADGVSRVPLERERVEYGQTTRFVLFEPDSSFPAHPHPGGEETVVHI